MQTDIMLSTPSLHDSVHVPQAPQVKPRIAFISSRRDSTNWGRRSHHGSWLHSISCAGIMLLSPQIVIFYWIALSSFDGSLSATYQAMLAAGPVNFAIERYPRADMNVMAGYAAWLLFQAALCNFLPSKISTGQLTPAGHLLQYRTNGLSAWIVTHALYAALSMAGIIDPAFIAKNWEALLVAVNVYGFILSGFAYFKAYWRPTHEGDLKFSGSLLYDLYMGVELNPRFGKYFDFKLFHNGRPGIIAWTLIDVSMIVHQYQMHGHVTTSIFLATILHGIYVVDFFINEDWYLRTIDICHDHFGFYLAWGSIVWLPCMYTLQTQFLSRYPNTLSLSSALIILAIGSAGYSLFRSVNNQKDLVRRTKGDCSIWGEKAKVLKVPYKTKDGETHESTLLVSGWWGMARHLNYLGDLVLSFAMCAATGETGRLLPWTYILFMAVLLLHRTRRDEQRCKLKYGKGWAEYCKVVRWVLVPGIY